MKESRKCNGLARGRREGQSAIIVALAMLVLLAFVGLAVDGGSMYANRRNAQNSADAAAMAGATVMLQKYDVMVLNNAYDVPGFPEDDIAINDAITDYASKHGIARSNLEAYYVNDDKQLVGTTQVGSTGNVPWDQGAKGVVVKNRSQSTSFFMKVFGWDKVGANATSSAFMGVAVDSPSGISLLPIGFFTNTTTLNPIFGQEYELVSSDITDTIGSGNWGYLDFNAYGSSNVDKAWITCGYNPTVIGTPQWQQWCADNSYKTANAWGPTQYFPCVDLPGCGTPSDTAAFLPTMRWGDGSDGWWLAGQTGTTMSDCHALRDLVNSVEGKEFLVPLFDNWIDGSGSGSRFHLARIAKFRINDANITCNGGGGGHWSIRAIYESFYEPGGTGRHGDVRHISSQTVFLDN